MEHKHLIVRCLANKGPNNKKDIENWLISLISKIGMKLLISVDKKCNPTIAYCNKKGNKGFTAAALIDTSHIVLHTWDEISPNMISIDVYSCSNFELDAVINHAKIWDIINVEYMYIDRSSELKLLKKY